MTTADLLYKWGKRFASNDTFDITAADLREYNEDCVTVFGTSNPTGAAFLNQKAGKTSFLLGTKLRDKTKLWLRLIGAGTLLALLPAPVLDPNRPNISAPGAPFALHASIGGPASGPAIIGEYTRQVSDGNHFQLTGAELAGATYPVYQNGNFYATSVTTQDAQKAAVQLPKVGAAFDAALTWASTSAGVSLPVLLNVATFQWGEDMAAEGLTITQYGRNLAHGNVRGGLSYLALQLVGGGPVSIITGTAATPYEAAYKISGLAKGVYKKWLHNGHGGDFGWSEAGTLTVVDRQDHVMTRNFGAPVFLPLSPSDGVANSRDIAKMFATLNGNGGGCFETDSGDFPSSEFIYPQNNVKWQCRTAATGGRTNLTITGNWNPGDCMLASNSWTMGALDGITFYKPDTVTIDVDALLILHGSRHIRLDNVGSTWAQPYSKQGNSDIPLNAQPLRITNSQYVFLNGCRQTGSGMHIGSRHNVGAGKSGVSRQLFVRNHTARLTNGADYTIYVQNTDGILIDGLDWQDLDPNSTDGLQRGAGRGPKFGGQGGSNQNAHVGRCNGRYLGPIFTGTNIFYDRNQGENFLWEGNKLTWKNYVVSATATTLTFAQPVLSRLADVQAEILPADSDAAGVLPGLHLLGITKGRGLWQVRGIVSVSGNTITLDRPLAVIPDATSYVQVGCFTRNNAVVDCTVSGKPNIATDPDYAVLCGINWFGGCWNSVVDNLQTTGERHGLITSMTTHADGDVDGCYFIEYRNSPPQNARWGLRFQACGHPNFLGWRFPVTAIGAILVSNCQPTGSLVADVVYELPRDQAALDLWDAPPIDLVTIENQASAAGLNEYRMASNPTNFPAIPVLPGAVANFAQLARQAQVLPTAPGVQLVAADEIGPLEPLPAGAAIDPANGVLSYLGTDPAVLVYVDGAQETPLDRTPVAGATTPGTAVGYTDAEIDAFLALKATRQELADLIGTAPAILDTFYELADWVQTDRAGVDDLLSRVNTLEIFNRFLNTDKVREGSLNRYYSDALADAGVGKYFGLDYTAEKGLPTTYQPGDIITAAFNESYVLPANTPSTPYRFVLPTSSNGQLNVRGGLIGFRFEGTSGTVTIALENGVKVSGGKLGSQAQATATLTLAAGDDYKVSRGPAFIYSDEKNYKLVSSANLFSSSAPAPQPAGVQLGTGTVLRFDADYEYLPISSGTFTTDLTTKTIGKQVVAYLGPSATDPAPPASSFQLLSGAYQSGANLMYTFKVGANGKIQYVITELP